MQVKKLLYRKKLLDNNFFKDVEIENEDLKKDILDWMFSLMNDKEISISQFKYLLSKYDGIVYPIKIYGAKTYFKIKDSMENEFYFIYCPYEKSSIANYWVGRRSDIILLDREFEYEITPEEEIVLRKMSVLELKEDNTNKHHMLTFDYNTKTNVTTVILELEGSGVEISYPSENGIYDSQIESYLLETANGSGMILDTSIFVFMKYLLRDLKYPYFLKIKTSKVYEILPFNLEQ